MVEVTSVKLDKSSLEIVEGKTVSLKTIIKPTNATYKTIAWSSSDESVVTVSQDGAVTAQGVGTTGEINGDKIDVAMSANTITKTESAVGGTMSLSVYSPKSSNATFILCIYDSENSLVAATVQNKALAAGPNTVTFNSISASVNKVGTYAVKVYTWNELEKMMPLTDTPVMVTMN